MSEDTTAAIQALQPEDTMSAGLLPWMTATGLKVGGETHYSTLRPADLAGRLALYQALQQQDHELGDHLGETILLAHVTLYPVHLADQGTGEVRDLIRCVVHAADGQTYGSMSTGVIRSLLRLLSICGEPPWPAPIPVRAVSIKTSCGYRYYMLQLDLGPPPSAPKKVK